MEFSQNSKCGGYYFWLHLACTLGFLLGWGFTPPSFLLWGSWFLRASGLHFLLHLGGSTFISLKGICHMELIWLMARDKITRLSLGKCSLQILAWFTFISVVDLHASIQSLLIWLFLGNLWKLTPLLLLQPDTAHNCIFSWKWTLISWWYSEIFKTEELV